MLTPAKNAAVAIAVYFTFGPIKPNLPWAIPLVENEEKSIRNFSPECLFCRDAQHL
jgi:hypothetical protein